MGGGWQAFRGSSRYNSGYNPDTEEHAEAMLKENRAMQGEINTAAFLFWLPYLIALTAVVGGVYLIIN